MKKIVIAIISLGIFSGVAFAQNAQVDYVHLWNANALLLGCDVNLEQGNFGGSAAGNLLIADKVSTEGLINKTISFENANAVNGYFDFYYKWDVFKVKAFLDLANVSTGQGSVSLLEPNFSTPLVLFTGADISACDNNFTFFYGRCNAELGVFENQWNELADAKQNVFGGVYSYSVSDAWGSLAPYVGAVYANGKFGADILADEYPYYSWPFETFQAAGTDDAFAFLAGVKADISAGKWNFKFGLHNFTIFLEQLDYAGHYVKKTGKIADFLGNFITFLPDFYGSYDGLENYGILLADIAASYSFTQKASVQLGKVFSVPYNLEHPLQLESDEEIRQKKIKQWLLSGLSLNFKFILY